MSTTSPYSETLSEVPRPMSRPLVVGSWYRRLGSGVVIRRVSGSYRSLDCQRRYTSSVRRKRVKVE